MQSLGTFFRRNFAPLMLSGQVLVDLAVVLLACWLGFELGERMVGGYEKEPPFSVYFQLCGLTAAVCQVSFHAFGMYSPVKSLLNVEEFKAIAKSTVVSFFVLFTLIVFLRTTAGDQEALPEGGAVLVSWFKRLHALIDIGPESRLNPDAFPRLSAVLAFALILGMTTISRFFSFKAIQGLHRRGVGNRNVLIYGTGGTGRWLQRKFLLVPTLGLRLVGFATEEEDQVGTRLGRSPVLGGYDDLPELVKQHKLSEIFIALPESSEERVMQVIEEAERLGLTFRVVPRFYHLMAQHVRIENLDSIPLISRPERRTSLVRNTVKRLLDILVAAIVLVLCLPLFAITAILIRRDDKGPVFFKQMRIGQNGQPFRMYKFRTMHEDDCGDARAPDDAEDPRITPVGRHLRRYSLDELPQFINVFLGHMSVVGPRPEMPFIVDEYGPLERERLRAKPGITGLWQISYHRQEAIHENLDYDVYYVENQSLLLDVVIMCLTVVAVVRGTGAH